MQFLDLEAFRSSSTQQNKWWEIWLTWPDWQVEVQHGARAEMGRRETALLGHHPTWAAGGALERAESHAAALATALPAQPAELPATRSVHSGFRVSRLTKAAQCPLMLTLLKSADCCQFHITKPRHKFPLADPHVVSPNQTWQLATCQRERASHSDSKVRNACLLHMRALAWAEEWTRGWGGGGGQHAVLSWGGWVGMTCDV